MQQYNRARIDARRPTTATPLVQSSPCCFPSHSQSKKSAQKLSSLSHLCQELLRLLRPLHILLLHLPQELSKLLVARLLSILDILGRSLAALQRMVKYAHQVILFVTHTCRLLTSCRLSTSFVLALSFTRTSMNR